MGRVPDQTSSANHFPASETRIWQVWILGVSTLTARSSRFAWAWISDRFDFLGKKRFGSRPID